MTTGPIQLTLAEVDRGPGSLDGLTLVGIAVTPAYTFLPSHATAEDVTDFEIGGGTSRLAGTITVTVDPDDVSVHVALEDITADVDLSDEDAQGGLAWFRPGATDGDRLYVGFSIDTTGSGSPAYSPTYDSGFFDLSPYEGIEVEVDGGEL